MFFLTYNIIREPAEQLQSNKGFEGLKGRKFAYLKSYEKICDMQYLLTQYSVPLNATQFPAMFSYSLVIPARFKDTYDKLDKINGLSTLKGVIIAEKDNSLNQKLEGITILFQGVLHSKTLSRVWYHNNFLFSDKSFEHYNIPGKHGVISTTKAIDTGYTGTLATGKYKYQLNNEFIKFAMSRYIDSCSPFNHNEYLRYLQSNAIEDIRKSIVKFSKGDGAAICKTAQGKEPIVVMSADGDNVKSICDALGAKLLSEPQILELMCKDAMEKVLHKDGTLEITCDNYVDAFVFNKTHIVGIVDIESKMGHEEETTEL